MGLPFCGFSWIIYFPFNIIFIFLNLPTAGQIAGFAVNLIGAILTWLIWKYVAPLLYALPIGGMIIMTIRPILLPALIIWIILLLIAGPIMIFLC